MRKYGKYQRMPDGTRAKQPAAKSLLLQTYFTSLICVVLCVSMFFGTSYAWFTSEVTNKGNEIYIGTLDVGLFKQDGADWVDLSDNEGTLFGGDIRWEPGYTALETVKIRNEGDLAFRYALTFTNGMVNGAENEELLRKLAENFVVYVHVGDYAEGEEKPNSIADIQKIANGEETPEKDKAWRQVRMGKDPATLADILEKGFPVLSGNMEDVRADATDPTATLPGPNDSKPAEDTYIIALHMLETAGQGKDDEESIKLSEELMGNKIGLNVKLVAYQMSSEKDGFGEKYDQTAVTAEQLTQALQDGGTVVMASDIGIASAEDRVTMNGGLLDGNGKTITYSGEKSSKGTSLGVLTTSGGTVKNLTISGGDNGRALYITRLTSDLVVSGCTFSGAYAFNLNSTSVTEYTVNFTDTVFKSWTSYANVMKHANFTGCTFEGVLRPYGDTTLTNCIFTTERLDASSLGDGETITLIDCTYNGVSGVNAILTTVNGEIRLECESGLITVENNKTVVLNSNNE